MSEVEEVVSRSFIRMDVCTRVLHDQSSEFAGRGMARFDDPMLDYMLL